MTSNALRWFCIMFQFKVSALHHTKSANAKVKGNVKSNLIT